jgi:HEAT repeat protein
MRAPETRSVARAKLVDPAWAVRGAAALALGRAGEARDADLLVPLLKDPNAWVRRAAVYGLGQLAATGYSTEIRAALSDPDPEVQLAAIWAAGHIGDALAAPRLIQSLEIARPPRGVSSAPTLVEGDGAVRLVSDAEGRRFDALVEAIGSLAVRWNDPSAWRALDAARRRLTAAELNRPARLPAPLGPGEGPKTRRDLFEAHGRDR